MSDDLKTSIEQIAADFGRLNQTLRNLGSRSNTNQTQISNTNITREEDDIGINRSINDSNVEINELSSIDESSFVIENTNLENTGNFQSIETLASYVDMTEYNSNNVLEMFTVERLTNQLSLADRPSHIINNTNISGNLSTIELGEQATLHINETRETIENSVEHFNSIIKTKTILLNKMKEQSIITSQRLNDNIEEITSRVAENHEQAQNTINNISNPDNLNLFSTIFNLFANNLPVKLLVYSTIGVVGVTLFIYVGKYILKYNLLATINLNTSTNISQPPVIGIGSQQVNTPATFFSRIGDRIVKLVDIFISYLENKNSDTDIGLKKYK